MNTSRRLIRLLTPLLISGLPAFCPTAAAEPDFTPLFDGATLKGWTLVGGTGPGYVAKFRNIYLREILRTKNQPSSL